MERLDRKVTTSTQQPINESITQRLYGWMNARSDILLRGYCMSECPQMTDA